MKQFNTHAKNFSLQTQRTQTQYQLRHAASVILEEQENERKKDELETKLLDTIKNEQSKEADIPACRRLAFKVFDDSGYAALDRMYNDQERCQAVPCGAGLAL